MESEGKIESEPQKSNNVIRVGDSFRYTSPSNERPTNATLKGFAFKRGDEELSVCYTKQGNDPKIDGYSTQYVTHLQDNIRVTNGLAERPVIHVKVKGDETDWEYVGSSPYGGVLEVNLKSINAAGEEQKKRVKVTKLEHLLVSGRH